MLLEDFMLRGGIFDVIIALFVWYLYRKFKLMPTNSDTNKQVVKMKTDLDTSFMELWDYVDNSIKPIRSRVEARIRRSDEALKKEEALKDQETSKKTSGIITRSQLKKDGTHR